MKIFEVALFIIVFNMMLSILVQIPVFSETQLQPTNVWNQTESGYSSWQEFGGGAAYHPEEKIVDTLTLSFSAILKGATMILVAFAHATLLLPWFLSAAFPMLSPTSPIIVMVTGLVWMVYGVGIIQFLLGRGLDQYT